MVGSGETVAKISGYLVSPLIVAAFSNNELVLVAGLGFSLSTLFIWKLTKVRAKDFDAGEHHDDHHQQDPMGIKAITGVLKHDQFLFWISIMAMIGMVVYFTINYAFLKRVEESIHGSAEMAKFFGLFFGAGKAVNFITKSLLAGRIMKRLGIKYLVLILPMVLLVINLTGVVGQVWGGSRVLYLDLWFQYVVRRDCQVFHAETGFSGLVSTAAQPSKTTGAYDK